MEKKTNQVKISSEYHTLVKGVARTRGLKLEYMVDRVFRRGLASMGLLRTRSHSSHNSRKEITR